MASVVEKRDSRVEKSLKHGEPVFEIVGSDDDSDLEDGAEFPSVDSDTERSH